MADPVLVLHLTQGTTIAGAVAAMRKARSECHEVVDPALANTPTQQLVQWTAPARSLKHPAGRPETNNRGFTTGSDLGRCYQVEIVGHSEKVGTYGDVWYQRLAAYLDARCAALRIPPVFPLPFVGSQAYGASAPTRLTWDAWTHIAGIVGHQHVPGNEHWDPGALDRARLTRYMETTTMPPPLPETDPGARIQRAINANGLQPPLKVDGDCRDLTADGLDKVLAYLNAQVTKFQAANAASASERDQAQARATQLADANKTSADTIARLGAERDFHMTTAKRLEGERDTAVANREAAEAEVAMLRKQLQEGGRLPTLLAAIDMASTDIGRAWDDLNEAIAKARA